MLNRKQTLEFNEFYFVIFILIPSVSKSPRHQPLLKCVTCLPKLRELWAWTVWAVSLNCMSCEPQMYELWAESVWVLWLKWARSTRTYTVTNHSSKLITMTNFLTSTCSRTQRAIIRRDNLQPWQRSTAMAALDHGGFEPWQRFTMQLSTLSVLHHGSFQSWQRFAMADFSHGSASPHQRQHSTPLPWQWQRSTVPIPEPKVNYSFCEFQKRYSQMH